MPLELITQALRLINNLLEGDATRTAQSVAWFWLTWPLFKGRFSAAQQEQIEGLVRSITTPSVPQVKGDTN